LGSHDLKKIFLGAVLQISEFAKAHRKETFYAFALDDGLLCLNSEEKFNATLKKKQDAWERDTKAKLSIETVSAEMLEHYQEVFENLKRSKLNDHETFNEYLKEQIELDQIGQKRAIAEGNPYLKPEEIQSLKYNTGDWSYQGFGELSSKKNVSGIDEGKFIFAGVDTEIAADKPVGPACLKLIELNSGLVFSELKITSDFRIFQFKHVN